MAALRLSNHHQNDQDFSQRPAVNLVAGGSDEHFALLVAQCMADGGCESYGVFSILDRCFSVFD
jgi:hypothetical protein